MTETYSAAHKGAINESVAATWLLKQGYFVFPSSTVTGPVDMVAWKPGSDPILIDVKSANHPVWNGTVYPLNAQKPTAQTIALGIRILYVFEDCVSWDLEDLQALAYPDQRASSAESNPN